MASIDNKKADDMIPKPWIIECLKMFGISEEHIKFMMKAMKNRKMEFATGRQTLAEIKKKNKNKTTNKPKEASFRGIHSCHYYL